MLFILKVEENVYLKNLSPCCAVAGSPLELLTSFPSDIFRQGPLTCKHITKASKCPSFKIHTMKMYVEQYVLKSFWNVHSFELTIPTRPLMLYWAIEYLKAEFSPTFFNV